MLRKKQKILIVGGQAAGPSAAAKAKRINPNAEVVLFELTDSISYAICESPFAISNFIDQENELVVYTPEKLASEKNIIVKILHNVEKILPSKQKIVVRNLRTREIEEYPYDELIICTGSIPKKLNIEGEDGRNVFNLRNREDLLRIMNFLSTENPRSAMVIGGGYIALELAEAFKRRGLEVTIFHQYDLPMEGLELDSRKRILEELNTNGIEFIPNIKIEAFLQDKSGKVKYIVTNNGSMEADLVLVSIGVIPNVELAKTVGIHIGKFGGIVTRTTQQTNIEHIYSAGDCCEVMNIVTGKTMHIPLATIASKTAWVAGENAAGGRASFIGAIRALAIKFFNLEIAQVGISSVEAKENGFKPVSTLIEAPSKVKIISDDTQVFIHLIFDKLTKQILGANIYGKGGVIQRANILSVAIQKKLTIDELSQLDLIYAPTFAPLWDPVLVAANQAKKELKLNNGKIKS